MIGTKGIIIAVCGAILAIGLGFGGGWYYFEKIKLPNCPKAEDCPAAAVVADASTAIATTTVSDAELETCLKAKWGATKYDAINANPNLATVDDKFVALPCYK